jgi:hypothetical protein
VSVPSRATGCASGAGRSDAAATCCAKRGDGRVSLGQVCAARARGIWSASSGPTSGTATGSARTSGGGSASGASPPFPTKIPLKSRNKNNKITHHVVGLSDFSVALRFVLFASRVRAVDSLAKVGKFARVDNWFCFFGRFHHDWIWRICVWYNWSCYVILRFEST